MPTTAPEPGCYSSGDGWTEAVLPAQEIRLRPPEAADLPALIALAGDSAVANATAAIPHPFGEDDARAFVAEAAAKRAARSGRVFAVERLRDRVLVGCIGFDLDDDGAELGYWIGRPYWGCGYATEALKRLLHLLFVSLQVDLVHAGVEPENVASARVLEKAGLACVGSTPGRRGRCEGLGLRQFILRRDDWRAMRGDLPVLLVCAAALIDVDGRVLLSRRPEGRAMAGLWEFPGGKVHDGEIPEAALVRELKEELDIDVAESCLAPVAFASHGYETFHLLMPVFAVRQWRGQPRPREGQELKWLAPPRLADLPMPPADVPLAALLRDVLG